MYIEKLADYILVKTTFGFSLAWDGISGVYLKLSEEHRGKSCGLCANYNGIQSDDFVIQQGKKMEHKKGVGEGVLSLHPFGRPIAVSSQKTRPIVENPWLSSVYSGDSKRRSSWKTFSDYLTTFARLRCRTCSHSKC